MSEQATNTLGNTFVYILYNGCVKSIDSDLISRRMEGMEGGIFVIFTTWRRLFKKCACNTALDVTD